MIAITVESPSKIVVNAPNLEYFPGKGHISDDFVMMEFGKCDQPSCRSLVKRVYLGEYIICNEHVCNLFKGMVANAKVLTLAGDMVQDTNGCGSWGSTVLLVYIDAGPSSGLLFAVPGSFQHAKFMF